jgi:hypothetical protein
MRAVIPTIAAGALMLASANQVWAQPICRPTLAFTDVHYESMSLPRLERTWTVAFTVDSSVCATDSGSLSIVFTVWSENAPDVEFAETFQWKPGRNVFSKEFRVDEAVGTYRLGDVHSCPCRR